MIYFKACPRCQGDMHVTGDLYSRYVVCLQCGYEAEAADEGIGAGGLWETLSVQSEAGKEKVEAA